MGSEKEAMGSGGRCGDVPVDQFRPHAVCGEQCIIPCEWLAATTWLATNPLRQMGTFDLIIDAFFHYLVSTRSLIRSLGGGGF
jgi:hypothetical protein